MSTSNSNKLVLMYLRLAAECRNLAVVVSIPVLKAQFLRAANVFDKLADGALDRPTLH